MGAAATSFLSNIMQTLEKQGTGKFDKKPDQHVLDSTDAQAAARQATKAVGKEVKGLAKPSPTGTPTESTALPPTERTKLAASGFAKWAKAESRSQQRFFGMVHAVQKGDMPAPSKDVAQAAKSISKSDATDFAETKHKGLPEKKAMALRGHLKLVSHLRGTHVA